jgi:hypothetical protein
LLDQQLRRLEQAFLTAVGLRERMTRARLIARSSQGNATPVAKRMKNEG